MVMAVGAALEELESPWMAQTGTLNIECTAIT